MICSFKFFNIFILILIANLAGNQHIASASELRLASATQTSAKNLLNKLGYNAHDLEFTTKDGFIINIVSASNPLFANNNNNNNITNLYPILFVHGTFMGAATMLGPIAETNQPVDLRTRLQLANKNVNLSLIESVLANGGAQSHNSLPLLALNLGYQVFLLNRRGSEQSRRLAARVGKSERTLSDALVSLAGTLNLFGPNEWLPMAAYGQLANAFNLDISTGKLSLVANLMGQFWSTMGLPQLISSSGFLAKHVIEILDSEFWSASLDEQIAHDLPGAVDFVLEQTGKSRVHTVGYSSGGALILLAASEQQFGLAEKLASTILWSPSVHMDVNSDLDFLAPLLAPLLAQTLYVGPVPPTLVRQHLIGLVQFVCNNELAQRTICSRFLDFFLGYSGLEAPVTPTVLATAWQPVGSRELSHLLQMANSSRDGGPCKFKFNNRKENIQMYGHPGEPPCYKLAKINLTNLSIYVGKYDTLVSPAAVNRTISQLRVPTKLEVISEPGVYFNHLGPLFHDKVGRLLVVPSMNDIERVERERPSQTMAIVGSEDEDLGTCSLKSNGEHDMHSIRVRDKEECTLSKLA